MGVGYTEIVIMATGGQDIPKTVREGQKDQGARIIRRDEVVKSRRTGEEDPNLMETRI